MIFSKGTGYSTQAYNWTQKGFNSAINKVRERWDSKYRITDMSYGGGTWFMIFSKGTGYHKQAYNWMKSRSNIGDAYKDRWGDKYKLTGAAFGY